MSQEHRHNLHIEPRHIRLVVPAGATKDTICSFCGSPPRDEKDFMLRGPYTGNGQPARICAGCLDLVNEAVKEDEVSP